MSKETTPFVKAVLTTSEFVKKYKYLVAGGLLAILLLATGFFIYTRHMKTLENELSVQVNDLVRKWKTIEAGNASLSELPTDVAKTLQASYEKHKNTVNGKRALFTSALIFQKYGEPATALANYKLLYTTDKKHYCSPQAMLNAAIIMADQKNTTEAITLLKEFKDIYFSSFLYGECVLLLADIYAYSGDFKSAEETLKELSENNDHPAYAQKAMENLNTLAVKQRYLTR